ncbi:hypothetical protein K1X84_06975 [bacterium]|nr:hypothetical protein [bacterium]
MNHPDQIPTKTKSTLKQNLLISMGSIFFILLIMEIILRMIGYGNVETYLPDQNLIWRLKPNQKTFTKFGNKPVYINSAGLRDREFEKPKPSGTFRILVLGNSCTYGWGVSQEDTYSKVLEKKLTASYPSKKFEVINAGVIGYSIAQELEYLKSDGVEWNPDMVLISHTFNEGKRVNPRSPQEIKDQVFFSMKIKNILRNIALYHFVVEYNFSSQYVKLAKKVTEDPTWIADDAFTIYQEDLQSIIETSKQMNATPVFMITVTKNQITADSIRYSKHQMAMKEIAELNHIPTVDFMLPFRTQKDKDLYVDGGHPTEIGHEIMADEIFKKLFMNYQ